MTPFGRNCLTCAVRGADCFCSLPDEALRELQAIGTYVRFGDGESVLREGDWADRVYVVCQGSIKLTASSAEGRLLLVRIARPGDVLGLAEALKEINYQVAAEALEPCEAKVVGRAEFFSFMDRFRDVSRNAARAVALEYEGAMVSARRLALSGSAASKLAGTLLELGQTGESNGQESLAFRMPLTHEELGSMAGLSRETVTRLIAKFKQEGLLEREGERMILPQPAKMRELYC
jgi:CRP/FNR family transcriptional regulator